MRFRTYYSLKYSNMIDGDRPGQDQKWIPFPASKCPAFHPWIWAVLIPSLVLLLSCSGPERIIIFHAGSLSILVQRVIERFQANHPNVVIHAEASGSLDAVRKVSELKKPCDLVATADWRLIERFLVPQYSSAVYQFLGNELVVAMAKKSIQKAGNPSSGSSTWYDELLTRRYSYGISDRDRDPAGYYAHLAWKLAKFHYLRPGLYRQLVEGLDDGWIRPKSSELVALLQTRNLDFAFLYKSTALQHNMPFIDLPAQVSLGESSYADFYSRVSVDVAGGHPDSRWEVTGAPIRYGVCLLNRAQPHARRFLEFWLSPEAQQLYRELGFRVVPIVRTEALNPKF